MTHKELTAEAKAAIEDTIDWYHGNWCSADYIRSKLFLAWELELISQKEFENYMKEVEA